MACTKSIALKLGKGVFKVREYGFYINTAYISKKVLKSYFFRNIATSGKGLNPDNKKDQSYFKDWPFVPRMGVEPTRPNGHMALNHACLPVPAPRCALSVN